ncbi:MULTISPECIES: c-type cytochrome [Nitrosomonas]|uniref:Cbb3-type cytochrome c oxidase subunit III n=2 Tax=Nitrosomonas eutropha TaxID=916 RepID=A0ABX5MAT2_9PROT|nr:MULTISPECIES: cytochrome c [Nitrosomonas]ABI60260.1 cytochrome c, class I [Nitrosomonas eutropha C91]PXV81700.1 cbb3-type cytochrome c oxidase subunit III [Nitrosomonas eutropha]SCX11748.1 Cytochrome C oxidase, cbb3-type, subunit III [Nitrosomonas eutropha]SDW73171.1 Cytochrome C oxidase, cbb3-type, subunit III [Nitrosomonas eutropha]SEI72165.1 Cytochrome C oxidase, cbb3-type, subunit III [Nitrosomonas eutropha]
MKTILPVMLLGFVLFALGGCTRNNDYMPLSGATGEKIFKEACVQCHTPVSGNVMILRPEMANADAIMERVKNGKGIGMPAFPNLTGDSAQSLAEYVLINSVTR